MKLENKDQADYYIWQAKNIDYTEQNAHRYWIQLYQHFNILSYLNSRQRVQIIQDLSQKDTLVFHGNSPRVANFKIFKLIDRNEYFILRECRIPTAEELICYETSNKDDQRLHSTDYKELRRKVQGQASQIAKDGYYTITNEVSRKKSFGIFRIDQKEKLIDQLFEYNKNIKNSIQVKFHTFTDEKKLNNFKISITLRPISSPNQKDFHQLFPDIDEIKRSLLEVPASSRFKIQDTNYISYYFQEPTQERYYECKQPHLALAFQGGGVKGVSYVGVYNQITNLQNKIKHQIKKHRQQKLRNQLIEDNERIQQIQEQEYLQIKSVIGSSAGGILSLAFTTGVSKEQMLELCLMMDTFIQDLLIQTQQEGIKAERQPHTEFNKKNIKPIEPGYFATQADNLKNVVHDLGLIEDSLFNILIQTLKEPSIQDKLLKVIIPLVGSSISSLITFKEEDKQKRGEEWVCCCCGYACCCCKKTVKNVKSINYYGILYMALMSGQALQNVVAYLLVLYLKKAARVCQNTKNKDFKQKFEKFIKNKRFKEIQSYKDVRFEAQRVISQYQTFKVKKQNAKKKGARLLKAQMNYPSLPLMKFAKKITMKQYYSLNKIQFTCTSVDLVDCVQRFFNHKTTPDLPVCKAVQMTGSFPVAFQSQKWKRQWGYYNVTYNDKRKEIDLTGHNFTDGGLLANFPIRYIDNQKIRPMYFSHKVNKKTVLYGFGLEQLPDFPENIPQKQINDAIDSFKKQFLMRLTPKLLKYLICCSSSRYYENTNFQLIQFLLSLVRAMKLSDRKLNMQCFQSEIIKTKMPPQSEFFTSKEQYLQKLKKKEQAVQKFKEVVKTHFEKQDSKIIDDELKALKQLIQDSKDTQGQNIETFKKIFECQLGQHGVFSSALNQYKRIQKEKYVSYKFKNNAGLLLAHQFHNQLEQNLQAIKRELAKSKLNKKSLMHNFQTWYNSTKATIKDIRTKLNTNKIDSVEKIMFVQQQLLSAQITTRYKFTPFLNKLHQLILGENRKEGVQSQNSGDTAIKKLTINSFIEHQTYKKINKISKRVEKIIKQSIESQQKQTNKKPPSGLEFVLHVILQSFSISHYYYPQIMEIVQTVLFQINNEKAQQYKKKGLVWKKLSVNILSCTDYRAIYGVFYALGMKTSQIKKKMSELGSLFQIKKNLKQQFESQIWQKTSLSRLQTLIKRQWEQRFDIIEHVQEQQRLYTQEFQNQLNHCEANQDSIIKHRISQIEIHTYLQKMLNYVSSSFQELNKLQVSQRKDRIAQLLNLNHYKDLHQKYEKKGRRVLLNLMSHLTDLCIVVCQYIMKTEEYLSVDLPLNDDKFFKGMILQSMVSTLEYKKYIYNLLKQKAIDPSITLQKFYHIAQRKVLLNFNCIKTSQGRFSFINKNCRPNMPLWAALMSAASLPYLEGSFPSREQWQNDYSITSQDQNQANIYFNKITKQNEKSHVFSFISANFITRMPIELLSNNRVIQDKLLCQEVGQKNKIIELCFAFETKNEQKQRFDFKKIVSKLCVAMKGKAKFVNCWDLCKYFCEWLCCCCCSFEGVGWYFSDIMSQIQLMKLINLRVESNDNFIYHIYKNFLIKLPLRIGTLEFNKITNDKPYLKDTIRQAQQVVRQLTDIVVFKGQQLISYQSYARDTTLQISFVSIPNKPYFYRLKFISFTIWRTLKAKYMIFYKTEKDKPYTRIQYDYFDVPITQINRQIYLKFIYCSPTYKIKSRVHKIKLSNLGFPQGKEHEEQLKFLRAIFHFPYRNVLINGEQKHLIGKWDGLQYRKIQKEVGIITQKSLLRQQAIDNKQQSPYITIVTQIQNSRGSMFCTNQKCLPRKLKRLLYTKRIRDRCQSCQNKLNVLAMNCQSCNSHYCFHCKIENFIGIKKDTLSSTFERCCIHGHNLVLKKHQDSEVCLYCDKYYMSLWRDEICNLALCANCLIYIPEVQIQDTLEYEKSQIEQQKPKKR